MISGKIRIKLRSFDPALLDKSARKIAAAARSTGAEVSGPFPLPTKRTLIAVIRGPHIDKRGQEHFWFKRHQRLIDIKNINQETIEKISKLDLPAGVDVKIEVIT